jgi:predicted DNA binding CopG/RHH family protein
MSDIAKQELSDLFLKELEHTKILDYVPNKDKIKIKDYIHTKVFSLIKTKTDISRVGDLIRILPSYLTMDQKIESIVYNLKFDFNKMHIDLPKGFIKERNDLDRHGENPNETKIIYLENGKKQDVATFNFYFIKKNKSIELRINNLQGSINATKLKMHNQIINYNRLFGKLNAFYKEDWRVAITKRINNFGKQNNYKVILELPFRYLPTRNNDYIRRLFQYLETGIRAEIPIKNISLVNVLNTESSKELIFKSITGDLKTGLKDLLDRIKNKPKEEQIRIVETLRKRHSKYLTDVRRKADKLSNLGAEKANNYLHSKSIQKLNINSKKKKVMLH